MKNLFVLFFSLFIVFNINGQSRADYYWSGSSESSDNIDQGLNWFGGSNPSSGDNLYFNNTSGFRHWPYSNYGAGSYFGSIITYNGAGGIKLYGDNTYAYKFENNSDGNIFELSPSSATEGSREIGNRLNFDLEINPVGSGGVLVSCDRISIDNTNGARRLKVYGDNLLTINGYIYEKNGSGASFQLVNSATVVLKGNSTYTGPTILDGGTLELQGSLSSSAVTVGNGATLIINGTDITIASLTVADEGIVNVLAGKSLTVTGNLVNDATSGIVLASPTDNGAPGSLIVEGLVSGTGTLNAERYISAYSSNNDGWHLISSPVNAPTISSSTNLAPGVNDDFYRFNEVDYEWTNYKPGNIFTTMSNGYGYLVSYEAADTKYFTGVPNTDAVTINNLTVTSGKGNGWHLVGNPFPSAIKWNNNNGSGTDYWTLTNIAGTAKRMNDAGSYTDIEVDDIIPAMQGFFVQASNSSNELVIPVEAKTHNTQNWAKSGNVERILLVAHDMAQSMYQESIISLNDKATTGFDFKYDSRFMAWYAPQFYSIVNQEKLSTNCFPSLDDDMVLPFGFVKNTSTEFTIELAETIEGKTIYLTDLKTNTTQNLSENPIYSFTSEENDDPNRFTLHFGPVGISTQPTQPQVHAYVNGQQLTILGEGHTQVDIFDVQGRLLSSEVVNVSGSYSRALNLNSGLYIVRLQNNRAVSSTKVIVK